MTKAQWVAFEELPGLVGSVYTIDSFRISQDEVDAFEDITGVTESYSQIPTGDYPDGMIEGFHSLGLLDHLSVSLMRPDPRTTFVFNYGVNRLRFPSPLTVHDVLSYRLEVIDVRPKAKGYLLTYDCTISAVGSERPGVRAEWVTMALPMEVGPQPPKPPSGRMTPFQPKVS